MVIMVIFGGARRRKIVFARGIGGQNCWPLNRGARHSFFCPGAQQRSARPCGQKQYAIEKIRPLSDLLLTKEIRHPNATENVENNYR